MEAGRRPLDGITVLDFTHALAGPVCTATLADWGARVLKVENIGHGDIGRGVNSTPGMEDIVQGGDSFNGFNRNKEDICVDIRSKEAIALLKRFIPKVDVIVSNFRPGMMESMGLSYEACRELNPSIIWADISAYGWGEHINDAGMDVVIQARAGTVACTGFPDGEMTKPGPSLSDVSGGMTCVQGILLALYHRAVTGEGQKVHTSLMGSTMMLMPQYAGPLYNLEGYDFTRTGLGHPEIVPCQAYKAKGGYIYMAAGSNKLWAAMVTAMGYPEYAEDPRFLTNTDRRANKAVMDEFLEKTFMTKTPEEWEVILTQAGVPNSSIKTPREAFADAKKHGASICAKVEHPKYGTYYTAGTPIEMSATPARVDRPAPRLGEHTADLLKEFAQLSDGEIAKLEEAKVVSQYRE